MAAATTALDTVVAEPSLGPHISYLSDCHLLAHPNATEFTYKPGGVGTSRIDGCWASAALLTQSGFLQTPRSAIATFVKPLSADHAAVADPGGPTRDRVVS